MTNNIPFVPDLPGKLTLWAFRLPIWLYRLRLGWLLGQRFLIIDHIGRKSGLLRKTVLKVLHHDQPGDTYYIISAWGEKSNWYQNVSKTPEVVVHVGTRKFKSLAEKTPNDTAERELRRYAHRHPMLFKELMRFVGYKIENYR